MIQGKVEGSARYSGISADAPSWLQMGVCMRQLFSVPGGKERKTQNPQISAHHGRDGSLNKLTCVYLCFCLLLILLLLSLPLLTCSPSLPSFLSLFHKYVFCTYCVPGNVPRDQMDALCPGLREKLFLSPTHSPLISKLESVAWASPLG